MKKNKEFDLWCYTAQADGDKYALDDKPICLLTVLLYGVCDNNPRRFETALEILQAAYEAGQLTPAG